MPTIRRCYWDIKAGSGGCYGQSGKALIGVNTPVALHSPLPKLRLIKVSRVVLNAVLQNLLQDRGVQQSYEFKKNITWCRCSAGYNILGLRSKLVVGPAHIFTRFRE